MGPVNKSDNCRERDTFVKQHNFVISLMLQVKGIMPLASNKISLQTYAKD